MTLDELTLPCLSALFLLAALPSLPFCSPFPFMLASHNRLFCASIASRADPVSPIGCLRLLPSLPGHRTLTLIPSISKRWRWGVTLMQTLPSLALSLCLP